MLNMKQKIVSGVVGATLLTASVYGSSFKVAILPNEPFQKGVEKSVTIDSINKSHVDFAIFGGDTKDGKSECSNAIIIDGLKSYFDKLNVPTLYSVGDNEWTDCHRTSNGSYDPLERLALIRKSFFSKNTTQGLRPLEVQRQGKLGGKFSENSRLIYNGVMFVALDVIGSNNNLVATDKQCHKKSKRTQQDCDQATAEYHERNKADIAWLKASFEMAKEKHVAGVVVVAHADIYFPFELSDHGYKEKFLPSIEDKKSGFKDFFNTLVALTHDFKGQVLLAHGDSHYYKVDKAMFDKDGSITSNFTRLENFGSNETSWVELTVDTKSETMFTFKPVMLPSLKKK